MPRFCFSILLFLNGLLLRAQVSGCTDPLALNFNVLAQQNDGSCVYAAVNLAPEQSVGLPTFLTESSGLIWFEDQIWTHNDSQDTVLYALNGMDPLDYELYPLSGVANNDWEEISQDSQYVYIGDFGNNVNGNRTDLKVLRVEKSGLISGFPVIDTLFFSYSDQVDFSGTGPNNTDFDCEAFVIGSDRIYLFTKQWVSKGCSVYSLPKTPGQHVAVLEASFPVEGLITGATYWEEKRLVVFCGYSPLLQPFLFLLYDFEEERFFEGNKRKIGLSLPFHQVEGICTRDGLVYYASNERFNQSILTVPQKLHTVDLGIFLNSYLYPISAVKEPDEEEGLLQVYFSLGKLRITLSEQLMGRRFEVMDLQGKVIGGGILQELYMEWDFGVRPPGVYVVKVEGGLNKAFMVR